MKRVTHFVTQSSTKPTAGTTSEGNSGGKRLLRNSWNEVSHLVLGGDEILSVEGSESKRTAKFARLLIPTEAVAFAGKYNRPAQIWIDWVKFFATSHHSCVTVLA